MAEQLSAAVLLNEVAKNLAELNKCPLDAILPDLAEWQSALGHHVETSTALLTLVQSLDYWDAVKLPPIAAIKFKELVLSKSMEHASKVEWKLSDKRSQDVTSQRDPIHEQPGSLERTDIFFNVIEIQTLYGGLGTTFARANGKITRALLPLKAHPRAPEQLWVATAQDFTIGEKFPMFIWRSYDKWEYIGTWRIYRVIENDTSIPAEVTATQTSLKMELIKFKCPQHVSKEVIESCNQRLLSALALPSTQ